MNLPSNALLYFDIETVPQCKSYAELPEALQKQWEIKHLQFLRRNPDRFSEDTPFEESFAGNAGIFAEFGKIVCISVGYITYKDEQTTFKVKSFYNHDEKVILNEFAQTLEKWGAKGNRSLCGHNIKEFDVPFVARRMIINKIPLPELLQVSGKKPWEIQYVDTLEAWKFGDYKHYTSLNLLAAIFGIPSPKDDIDGSQVAHVYYAENDLERIANYCEKDVITTAQVLLSIRGEALINTNFIQQV